MPAAMFAFSAALVASVSLTPPIRTLALRLGILDRPNPRKVHLTPIPLLGGLAIYAGTVLALILFIDGTPRSQIVGILAGSTLLVAVGVLDDLGCLHHQFKLLIAMPVAALLLLASGIQVTVFSSLLSPNPLPPGSAPVSFLADAALTLFWVVGITAAFSILDHMDGLCAGVAAIASAFFLLCATLSGQVLVGTLAAALLGAAVGFLRWNFKPAKIFMGDGGAMFLGFILATLGLKLRFVELPLLTSWMISVLILAVPIFDTTLVTISRARRGLIPFMSPGKDHTAHRLENIGLGQRGAVLALYAAGGCFGLLALLLMRLSLWQSWTLGGVLLLVAAVAIVALERTPYERQERIPGVQRVSKGEG